MATPAAGPPPGTNTNLGVGSSIYSGGGGGGGGGFGNGLTAGMSAGFRVSELILALLTWILIASSDQRGENFTPYYAFTFLLSIAVIYTAWLLVMLLVDLIKMFGSSGDWSATMLAAQSIVEFIFMMLMFAAACSAACMITQLGAGNILITSASINYCSYFNSFCSIIAAGVAMAFLCSFVQVAHFWFLARSWMAAM